MSNGWTRTIVTAAVTVLVGTNLLTAYEWQREKNEAPITPAPAAPKELAALPGIINSHDHVYRLQDFEKYLPAADSLGIAKTLCVASSAFTLMGPDHPASEGNDLNTNALLDIKAKYPEKVIVFATVHPSEENKVDKLKDYVARGAQGLKLYTGHGEFYDRPLLDPLMEDVYAFCEETQLPVCWHINMTKYAGELTRVLLRYPKLKIIIPHFGVGFYEPGGQVMQELDKVMEAYPNIYTDCSFGTRNILVAGLEEVSDNVPYFRDYFIKHQDRIIWGTDMVITGNKEKTTDWMASVIRACRDMLEKDEYHFWMAAKGTGYGVATKNNAYGNLRGLNLPQEVLKKIYTDNLNRILGAPPPAEVSESTELPG